ncbi:MAG: hypothetical protein ACFWTR_27035 [Pseudomonas shahriarae]|uniref:hypothetical protein n=1 Tax=Pseudomonas shahriarae TaxID=2745512 RepID=UPI003A0FCCC7
MVDSLDDGRDFNKARGFLLTYSALVLALWYFGADLTQFKLMGNEVQLHQRTNSVWLVLAALNAYFWFRCYQRIHPAGLNFDKAMDGLYEASLRWVALTLGRRKLKQEIVSEVAKRSREGAPFKIQSYATQLSYRPTHDLSKRQRGVGLKSRILLHEYRVKVYLMAKYKCQSDKGWLDGEGTKYYVMGVFITWPIKIFIVLRGAFITPWFTDYVAPLLFGFVSTGFALWKWYSINFLTSSLQHHTLMCAGVSTTTHGQISFLL